MGAYQGDLYQSSPAGYLQDEFLVGWSVGLFMAGHSHSKDVSVCPNSCNWQSQMPFAVLNVHVSC